MPEMGQRDLPSRVAIHEAGHAVAHLARGHAIDEVTIEPSEDHHSRGHVIADQLLGPPKGVEPNWMEMIEDGQPADEVERLCEEWWAEREEDVPGMAAGCVAGEVAERIAFGEAEEDGLVGDREQMNGICLHAGEDDETHQQVRADAYALAESLLTEHWPAVLALAAALEERKTLTGAEAAEAYRDAKSTNGIDEERSRV